MTPYALMLSAQAALERAAALLSNAGPEALDASVAALEEAAGALKLHNDTASEASPLAASVRKELARVDALVRHARGFHQGFLQIAAAGTAGYDAQGGADVGAPRGTLSIEG